MATRKPSPQKTNHPRFEAPTVSIYQNGEYVSGILQQLYGQPLLTDFSSQAAQGGSESTDKGGGANAGAKAKGGAPGLGSIELNIGADYDKRLLEQKTTGTTSTQNFQYTQAYYLYAARAALKENGALSEVSGREDAGRLQPGDLVEYTATFSPSQLISVLDIVTPEMVSAIVRKMTRDQGMKEFVGGAPEAVQAYKVRLDSKVEAAGEVAFAVTTAAKVDFRSETTREFYGRIGDGEESVTAVTICDLPHFIVADKDRILDGEFKVLGKVTSRVQHDVPILARNKVLDRINPESVDELVGKMNESVVDSTQEFFDKAEQSADKEDEKTEAAQFDFSLDSRVAGPSFNVVPIAIYI